MREEFIKRAPILCEAVPTGSDRQQDWQWYFMMQQYTRRSRYEVTVAGRDDVRFRQ
jgi:hypothetical protein